MSAVYRQQTDMVFSVLHVLGLAGLLFAAAMVPVFMFSAVTEARDVTTSILIAMLLTGFFSGAMVLSAKGREVKLDRREAFLLAAMLWTVLPVFGALPLLPYLSPWDAYFEALSALTTTGYTSIADFDAMPRSVLLWRSVMQWCGGLATILLAVVLLGLFGLGGLAVYRSAIPSGSEDETLVHRLQETFQAVLWVYGLLTFLGVLALWLTGTTVFESLCFAMSAISSGGFSPHPTSAASLTIGSRLVLVLMMLIAAVNFTLHWAAFHGRWRGYLGDSEIRILVAIGFVLVPLITYLLMSNIGRSFGQAVEEGLFAFVSVMSTTGFIDLPFAVTVGATEWPAPLSLMLLILAMVGGAAGSTAGGIKLLRMYLLMRQGGAELTRLSYPSAVVPVRYGGFTVSATVLQATWNFLMLFVLSLAALTVLLAIFGIEFQTAITLAVGALSNSGPAMQYVMLDIPAISELPLPARIALMGGMLAGRLEILALLGLMSISFWRR